MTGQTDIVTNRKALRDYFILERIEAGLALKGTEIKSIRAGRVNISDAFARVANNEAFLVNASIQPYDKASHEQHEPDRPRKLLLHRREIDRLGGLAAVEGRTLVILRLYWKGHLVKAEIGVGKGKLQRDKREDVKKREADREARRAAANFNRRRA